MNYGLVGLSSDLFDIKTERARNYNPAKRCYLESSRLALQSFSSLIPLVGTGTYDAHCAPGLQRIKKPYKDSPFRIGGIGSKGFNRPIMLWDKKQHYFEAEIADLIVKGIKSDAL